MVLVGKDHHLSMSRGYAYKHRLVAEKKLGRRLKKKEQVHHKDENRQNNVPSNLEVCTHQEHKLYHRKKQLWKRLPGEKNPWIKCLCGCGRSIRKFNIYGKPRTLVYGHRKLKPGSKNRCHWEKDREINCACGCGKKLMRFDKYGRVRSRLQGHAHEAFSTRRTASGSTH
jgi:hypothetical protein